MNEMNIGQAAKTSGVSAKMIRHYEEIGLIQMAQRTAAGYRVYREKDLHILHFIKQARNLGFSMDQISELLSLWQNKRRTSRKVKELAMNHIDDLEERIRELQEMKNTISHLMHHCHGDDRPDCPIIEGLASGDNNAPVNNGKNKRRHLINS